jgi:hypothetical protein
MDVGIFVGMAFVLVSVFLLALEWLSRSAPEDCSAEPVAIRQTSPRRDIPR